MDQLFAFDERLYSAIVAARNPLIAVVAIVITYLNVFGLQWWLLGIVMWRTRGGRRGLWVALTIFIGMILAWATAEIAKEIVRRPRPFIAIPDALRPIIPEPSSYSFPSGDTALAFGAAVAFGQCFPRFRPFALLLAFAVGLSRVFVGVHYPVDALGGVIVGTVWGLLAPPIVAWLLRLYPWRAFVVPHTHWDREWYERFEAFRARLVPMVGSLLDLLEREPRFRSFTFDGQTIPLEDHLAVRPGDRGRIQALVRADRLIVGPWYVLADLLLVSGESIVRNLQEGLRVAGSLGRASRVAYVADPFGHPAQLPQLLRGFGYGSYVFARGVGDEGEELGSEFSWEAPSGDRVLASHQVAHYDNALPLVAKGVTPVDDVRRRVRRTLPRIMARTAPYAAGDALLFMVGTDHTPAFANLPDAVDAISQVAPRTRATIATLEEFVAALPAPRGVFVGEMVSGKYRPILRGVNSTRAWIKQENAACERLLLERCEPLDAFGGGIERETLRSLWRTLLENHPHDSICGCSIDAVHDLDMRPRFARVRATGERLVRELSATLGGPGGVPVAWNPLPWARDVVVTIAGRPTVVRCAALGVTAAVRGPTAGVSAPEAGVIENERLRVEVDDDGGFTIIDRATEARSGRMNVLIDEGDRGDEYTYSYAGPTIGSKGLAGRRATRVDGDRAMVTVDLALRLPASLRDDRFARGPELVDNRVRFVISLDAGAARVDVAATVTNASRDHRLKVVCETGRRTTTHTAGAGFAWLERPNRVPRKRGWVEPPTPERCFHDLVAVGDAQGGGLAIGADGLREYSVLSDGSAIAVTLFRAVGFLSRGDLPERRGHAGPELETPSAQCLGEMTFGYSVVPLREGIGLPQAARAIREFLSPAWLAIGAGEDRSFCSLDGDPAVTLSAIRARSPDRLVVRLVNPGNGAARATLRFAKPVRASRPLDLREGELALGNTGLDVVRTAAPLELHDDMAAATLEAFEIGTWEIDLA